MALVRMSPAMAQLSGVRRLNAGLVRRPNGCLEWSGRLDRGGYGQITVAGRKVTTHRFAWIAAHGPILPGLDVLHRCDNPPCCDAYKCLWLGTEVENMVDRDTKGRNGFSAIVFCPQGHEYTEANTYVHGGKRMCRKCRLAADARYKVRRERARRDAARLLTTLAHVVQ